MNHFISIAFDGKTPQDLKDFINKNRNLFVEKNLTIKINDLLAEVGIQGIKQLQTEIQEEIGVKILWMIDGKWFDIPNTVANYARRLDGLNVAYYTVHASGGPEMIRAAKSAAPNTKLLAITILTSMQDDEVSTIYDANRADSILRLAKSALTAGADGLVCSPADAPMLRQVFGNDFLLVTPNIQREGVERNDDQNKALTNTPRGAIENGSSDIVVGRPILTAENPGEVIQEMLEQMNSAQAPLIRGEGYSQGGSVSRNFAFEKILHTGDWESLLKYIGAIYRKPTNGKYVRLTSGFLSDTYINIGASERDYRVLDRASHELALQMKISGIEANHVMGAQMGSVRLSSSLARAMSIGESTYTEKDGDAMALKRHDLGENGFVGKKVVLSEDVITKGSTLAKMIEIVKHGGGEVVAVTCAVNRSGRDNYEGIPLFHCYTPPAFGMWWDDKTLEKTQANEQAAGKTSEQIGEILDTIQSKNTPLPENSQIAEKPKNEWNELVKSMRV